MNLRFEISKLKSGILLSVVSVISVVNLGCVRPTYDTAMGEANILAAEAVDASVADLAKDNLALRDKVQSAAFAIVSQRADAVNVSAKQLAASTQPSPAALAELVAQSAAVQAGIVKMQAAVATEQAERAVIAEIVRKARVASDVVRTLGLRSKAIGAKETELLGSLGVTQNRD